MESIGNSIAIVCEIVVDRDDVIYSPSKLTLTHIRQRKRKRAISNFACNSKIEGYVSLVLKYSPSEFIYHFRITHSIFETILILLPPFNYLVRGKPPYENSFCLILTLCMLTNEELTYRQVGEQFGISESTTYRIFKSTINSIANFEERYIVWPKGIADQKNINASYSLRKVPFPGAFCVIDCTHIRINGFLSDNSYLNRNHYHSVILQGICDFKGKFINVFVGYPGSSHDAAVWANSPIYQGLLQNQYEIIPPNCFILGDSAYPLTEFLMKPYRDDGHLKPHQREFNRVLSSSRVVIEQAFGELKGRFRRLKEIETLNVEAVSKTAIAACILHNLCTESDQDDFIEILTEDEDLLINEEEYTNNNSQNNRAHFDVIGLRESIALHL